jgi:hypothetical protein
MLESILADPKERALHTGTVHKIAAETGLPDANVATLYEQALAQLVRTARVRDFLPVLTGRMVTENLRAARREQHEPV